MRLRQMTHRWLLGDRPFETAGASVYARVGTSDIVYRRDRVRTVDRDAVRLIGPQRIPKTTAIAHAEKPDSPILLSIPDSWKGQTVYLNVRTHAADRENEQIDFRALDVRSDGTFGPLLAGTASQVLLTRRDSGGLRCAFQFARPANSAIPTGFRLVKTAGPGTVADGTTSYLSGQFGYVIDIASLTNQATYTFELRAYLGSTVIVLASGLTFVADASGPPAVTAQIVEL